MLSGDLSPLSICQDVNVYFDSTEQSVRRLPGILICDLRFYKTRKDTKWYDDGFSCRTLPTYFKVFAECWVKALIDKELREWLLVLVAYLTLIVSDSCK